MSVRYLNVSYAIWKQLVQNNEWAHYHYADGEETRYLYTGNRDQVVRSYVDDDFEDWQTVFSATSVVVVEKDDAEAQIVGLIGLVQQPLNPNGSPVIQMERTQADQVPVFAISPRVGNEEILATSNYADKCSWFGDSVRVTDETMTEDTGDATGKTFESAHSSWIDMLTGRVLNEDKWKDSVSHGYQVVVKDNGVEQTVRPFPGDPGTFDCEILWKDGKVRFLGDVPTGPMTVSYSYADGSTFYLSPDSGQVLRIESGEADFAVGDEDGDYRIEFLTEIDYNIWGYAWYYAPQYPSVRLHAEGNVMLSGDQTIDGVVVATGDQVALFNQTDSTEDGMWIAVVEGAWVRSPGMAAGSHVAGYLYFPTEGMTYGRAGMIVASSHPNDVIGTNDIEVVTYFASNVRVELTTDHYKRALQIIMEAKGAHPIVLAVGATMVQLAALKDGTWDLDEFRRQSRGFASDIQPIPFPYETVRELESSKGHQLRISTFGDIPQGGETVTLTFYCTSWAE